MIEYRVTVHALERYRLRVDPAGTGKDILALLAASTPPKKRHLKLFRRFLGQPGMLRCCGGVLMVVKDYPTYSRVLTVLTVADGVASEADRLATHDNKKRTGGGKRRKNFRVWKSRSCDRGVEE